MSCTVTASIENWQEVLRSNPQFATAESSWRSQSFHELLVPVSRQRYDGQRRNLFGFVEWRYQLEDSVFFNLAEQERATVDAADFVAYLTRLMALIDNEGNDFPRVFAVRDAAAKMPVSQFGDLEMSGGRIEAGYDYCQAEINGVWQDLRSESFFEAVSASGENKKFEIVAVSLKNAFAADFAQLLQLAKVASDSKARIVLEMQQPKRADEFVQGQAGEASASTLQADEDQLKAYMKMVDEIPIPTPDQEEELVAKIELFGQAGADARKRLMQGYFRLVLSLATKYLERGVRLLDLIAAANQALAQAVSRYDFASGVTFSNYATWIIETKLQRIVGEHCDALPSGMEAKLERAKELSESLARSKGRPASEKELAQAMGMNVEELRRMFEQV